MVLHAPAFKFDCALQALAHIFEASSFGSAHTLLYALPVQVQLGVYMYDITDPCRVRGTHDMHAGLDFKVEFVGA